MVSGCITPSPRYYTCSRKKRPSASDELADAIVGVEHHHPSDGSLYSHSMSSSANENRRLAVGDTASPAQVSRSEYVGTTSTCGGGGIIPPGLAVYSVPGLTLLNVNLRFGGGESSVIIDRGSGLFTENKVRSMIEVRFACKRLPYFPKWSIEAAD